MRQVRDVGEGTNMLSREIALVGGRSATELAKWEVRSASTAGLEELGIELESSIFHYALTDQSDDIFEGVDPTDGDAMWARYGPEIMEEIRASGLVPDAPAKAEPEKPEPPALPPPEPPALPTPVESEKPAAGSPIGMNVDELAGKNGESMRRKHATKLFQDESFQGQSLASRLGEIVDALRKRLPDNYSVAQIGDQLVLFHREERKVLAFHNLVEKGTPVTLHVGAQGDFVQAAKADVMRREGTTPARPELTHKEKLDQERTFLIVHLDDAIKEQRKLAEGKPLSEFAQNVLRLDTIRARVASEVAGAMAQGREALEAIKAGKPVREWSPPGLTPRQKEDLRKAREKKREQLAREYERTLFASALTSDPVMQLAQLGEANFMQKAPEIIGRQIKELQKNAEDPDAKAVLEGMLDGDKAKLPDKFLKSLYNQARERFKELEKQKHRDPAIYQAAHEKAAIDANIGDTPEMRAAFKEGFDHALKGKTRSSLTGNLMGVVSAGYDAAREWMKTPEGRYFFDGKRGEKEKSTGEELRRHWELVKKDLADIDTSDMKKAWERVKRATVRADAFPVTLAEDATPGAKSWMQEFREGLATFSEYFVSRATGGVHARYVEQIFNGKMRSSRGEFNELPNGVGDDAQRLAKTVEMARDYVTVMNDLANRFTGMKTLAEIEPVLKEIFGNDYPALKERPYVKANEHLFATPLYHRSVFTYVLPWTGAQSKYQGQRWRELVKTENDVAAHADTRSKPLVRPRLDKIERGGMAYDRKGRNITTEEFKHTFKFADVTIGRYVTSEQAQDHLNYAYDALLDLSDMLGARPEQLSFGGKLHFAIGALGHGKQAAHFNEAHPLASGGTVPVINVTNTQGDGSVLHEYFHAIDLLTRDPATRNAIKEVKAALERTPKGPDDVIPIVRRYLMGGWKFTRMGRNATPLEHAKYAMQSWYASAEKASDPTQFYREAEKLDGGKPEPYWSNDFEPWARAAEAWGVDLLKAKPARSDYLLSPQWMDDGYAKPPRFRGTPYPEGEERKAFNAIFQAFIDQLEWTDNGPRLKDGSSWRDGKTPMKARLEAFHTARKEALEKLPELQKMFEAEKQAEIQKKKDEKDAQFFAPPPEEPPPAAPDPAPSPNDTGPLTDGELDTLFDDAAAQVRESIQEEPADPGPGAEPDTPGPAATIEPGAAPAEPEKAAVDPTAAQLIKAAAAEGVKGIDETLKAIAAIFGAGPGKLSSFPGGFDEDAYKKFKPHFEKALEAYKAAGKALVDFFRLLVKQFGEGIKPYAVRFAKDMKLGANLSGTPAADPAIEPAKPGAKLPEAPEADPARPIANWVQMRLEHSQPFDWRDLFATADNAYGGTQAQGKYAVKDAYDAMELGVNQFLLTQPAFLKEGPRSALAALDRILNLLPTQTKRTLEQDEFQQFSTPPTHAFLANWVANVQKGESYHEPSAGIGGLAVFGKNAGARVSVNELSARRMSLLHALPFDRFTAENAEHLNAILPADIKPTVIVMNPPFSATAGRMPGERDTMNGAKHIEEALKRLEPGGRLVAIVGEGMGADKPAFKMWWGKIKKDYTVRANIGIEGKAYVKYGTSFGNQILVIDKIGPQAGVETVTGQVATPADAVPLLEAVRVSRTLPAASTEGATPGSPQTGVTSGPGAIPQGQGPGVAGLPGGGATAGVGAGGTQGPAGGAPGGGGGLPGGSQQPPRVGAGGGRGGDTSGQQGGRPGGKPPGTDRGDEPLSGRTEDLGSGAESPLVIDSAAEAEAAGGEIDNSTFENYTPKKVRIEGAHAHVTPLVESAALASVLPPDVTYRPHLPPAVITEGKLSLAQLEAVIYAGQAHSQMLPDGNTRRGHFIGDGTGVGKGREISGIILDNWGQGRKRHIWFSEKAHLLESAQRDFKDTGGDPSLIHSHYDYEQGKKIELKEGILFSTYSLLRSQSKARREAKKKGDFHPQANQPNFERNQQILEWLGPDFDGVIAFDESHNMANSINQPGARGAKEAAAQALAAVELQRLLPKARIEYVSATGATEITNLAYAERLGLWGPGTPFANFGAFSAELGRSVTIMELVAQNMKQLGLYSARSLSYNGGTPETTVVYDRMEHELTDYQKGVYDELAKGWQIVLNNLHAALEATGVTRPNGAAIGARGSQIKSNAMSQFWGTMQRFFNQVITSMQMPSVFDQVDKDLASGKSVVFQVTRTQGADLDRELTKRGGKPTGKDEEMEDLDLTPRESLVAYLMKSFPVQLQQPVTDADGNVTLQPVVDSQGQPVLSPEALAKRNKLIEMLRKLDIPEGPLQQLMAKFGPEGLAEVTGRTERTVPGPKGGNIVEKRNAKHVAADILAFNSGKKRALVFNNAGGTGVSFHSDRRFKNQQRRSHYIIQTDWSANKVVQATGRTHRTNQALTPIYHLVTTDIPAQKRFISSVARRLEQLGALTAGQRDTAGGGSLFSASDNLESQYASRAVRQFFTNLINVRARGGGYANLSAVDVLGQMGLSNLMDQNGRLNESELPQIPKFLNRLLALTLDTQKEVFKLFSDELDLQIETAKQDGTFDDGMRTIQHIGAAPIAENTVYQDEKTNASTKHYEIAVKQPNKFYDFDNVGAVLKSSPKQGWFKNKKSGRVQGVWETASMRTDRGGVIHRVYGIYRTSGSSYETADKLDNNNLERISEAAARELWEKENAVRPAETTHTVHMVVGSMLPIWNRFNNDHVDVARIKLDDGRRLLGRVIAQKDIENTLGRLNVKSAAAQMSGDLVIAHVMGNLVDPKAGIGSVVRMSNGWIFRRSVVSGEPRVEITNFGFPSRAMQTRLAAAGAFFERIDYKERLFVPTDGGAVIDKIMTEFAMNPVEVTKAPGAQFSLAFAPDRVFVRRAINGLPVISNSRILLNNPRRAVGLAGMRGDSVLWDVLDQEKWVKNPGLGLKDVLVGGLDLSIGPDNQITGLNGILIEPELQNESLRLLNLPPLYYGENALRTVLASLAPGKALKINGILPKARGFWEKMGMRYVDPGVFLDNGELTREAYERARRPIEDGRGAGSLSFSTGPRGGVAQALPGGVGAQSPDGRRDRRRDQAERSPEALRAELTERLGRVPTGTTIVQNWNDLPADILDEVVRRGAFNVQGAYHPPTNTTYLVSSNIEPGFGLSVYLHEVGVHRGLAAFIGEQSLSRLSAQIEAWSQSGANTEEARLAAAAAARVPDGLSAADRAEELIAYFVEEAVRAGHDTKEKSAVGDWLRRLAEAIVSAFNKLTGRISDLTAGEIVALARGAANHAQMQRTPVTQPRQATKFSLANDVPLRQADNAREAVLRGARAMGASALADDEGVLNAWMKTVGTPELISRKNAAFKKVFWEGQAYLADINRSIGEAEAMLPSWFKGQDILSRWFDRVRGKEVAKAEKATRALLDGTLNNKIFTSDELAARGLSQKEIEMYEDARMAIDAILAKTGAALINKIAPQYGERADRLIRIFRDHGLQGIEEFVQYSEPVGKARIARLEAQIADEFVRARKDILRNRLKVERLNLDEWKKVVQSVARINKLQREGYFPLSRYGTHYVSVTDPRGQAVEFRMYETALLARKGAYQLAQRYPHYEVKRGTVSQLTNELYAGMTPEAVELFAEITGHDQDEAMQLYLKEAIANRSALKRMIHRKGTEGYSEDAVRVLADFISVNARHQSRLAHGSNLTEFTHDIRGGALRDYAIKMVQYLRGDDGREEYHATRGFLFFQYIGGNVSSALLNLTQVPMFTYPWLTQHTSVANAGKVVGAAYKLALSTEPVNMTGELGEAVRKAETEGLTDPQNVYTTMAIGAGSKLARVRAFSGLLDTWAFFFSRAERLNRRVTFIAAYQLAQESPGVLKEGQSAYDFATEAVNDTQLIYNKGNRPAWARGIGSIPFTFKLFTIGMLENIFARMPRTQMLMILGLLMLAAGAEGLPFAEDLEDALDTVGQKLGFATNTKKMLKESLDTALQEFLGLPRDTALYASEMLRKGVFAGTPLETIGRRIGMGNIIPGTSAFLTGRDIGGELVEAGGPLASFARNVGAAAELAARGEFGRAGEKVLPTGIANIQKGLRQADEGEERTAFGKKVADVTPTQAALQTVGISSANVARRRERDEIIRQDEQYLKVVEDRIADKWAQAIINKDEAAKAEAREELRDHNERNPGQKILISPLQIQMRVKYLRLDPEKALLRTVARERRAQAREFLLQP
jgi:hypothetical protein